MDLSILIVNWKSVDYLKPCLTSLFREIKGIQFEVIVVDNASYDGSADLIKSEFLPVTFVQSRENLGFSRANNLAFQYAAGRNILLLNPDTEVLGNAIQKMLSQLEVLPHAGAIGCRLVNADGNVQFNSIQSFPTVLNQLLDANFLKARFPNSRLWKLTPLFNTSGLPVEVDSISGACFMVKRHVFEQVGLISEDYLMYSEDLDLSYKVRRAGFRVYYTNGPCVVHHGGKSSASWQEALADVRMRDSIHKFLVKFRGPLYGVCYKAVIAAAAVIRLVLIFAIKQLVNDSSRRRSLTYASMKWKRLLQWALGMKRWARQAGEQIGFAGGEW